MDNTADILIIKEVQQGNRQKYALLVERYKDIAFNLAFKIIQNRENAEEVVQDAFMKAYSALNLFRGDAKFSTWIFRIVYNTAISRSRLRKQKMVEFDKVAESEIDSYSKNEFENDADDTQKMVNFAIASLADDEKAIVTLYYLNESSINEISTITGLSEANVKVKLYRIRQKLKEKLSKQFN